MDKYISQKYFTDLTNLKHTLDTYGVAIIPNLLNTQECHDMLQGLWDYFTHITQNWETPITKDNPSSWKLIHTLFPLHSMLIQHWGIGHCQAVWNVRQNPKIIEVFSHLWNTNDLLVSFDGASFNMPPETTGRGWNRNNTWFHCDQSFTNNEFTCVQSWVTALDVNPGDATLSFLEGSHQYHGELAKTFGITDKTDWYKLNREQEEFYLDKGCSHQKISCPSGSLVLWDSRTIHCGTEAFRERTNPNQRAVIYLCYMPRSLAKPGALKKRRKAFNELRMTTHLAHKPKLFPVNPRTYGNPIPNINPVSTPELNEIGLKLID